MSGVVIQVVGLVAFVVGQAAFVPHVRSAWKTNDLGASSVHGWALGTLSAGMWVAYGLTIGAWWTVAASVVAFLIEGALTGRIWRLRRISRSIEAPREA